MNQESNFPIIKILKAYIYRGSKIYIRQINEKTFEFFVIFKNKLFTEHYNITDSDVKKFKLPEIGAAAFIVCNSAEGLIDRLIEKESFWHNLIAKHFKFSFKVEDKPKEATV